MMEKLRMWFIESERGAARLRVLSMRDGRRSARRRCRPHAASGDGR